MTDKLKNIKNRPDLITVVVPMYNEAENVKPFFIRTSKVLENLKCPWEILFINDGSNDETIACLISLHKQSDHIKIINLSRNFGKEIALSAGINHAAGDVVITIDADLQHTPEVIPEMIEKWRLGLDIVFAVRRTRQNESWVKRLTARMFYRLMGWLTEVPNHQNIGDFCLLDRSVVDVLGQLPEYNRFMKGLFSWVGFDQGFVTYDPDVRKGGKSKWNYWVLWNFAIEGITSFSTIPLRIWSYIGLGVATFCAVYALFIIIRTLILGVDVPGYASLIVSILFMSGLLLFGLGILGEYIGRIYDQVKGRPLYIVKSKYGFEGEKKKHKLTELQQDKVKKHNVELSSL